MNIKPKDIVTVLPSGEQGVVIATHTYFNGVKVVSVNIKDVSSWLPIDRVKKS